MPAPRLPRELLWTDKKSIDDFMGSQLFREIHNVFLEMEKYPLLFKMDELQIFNEVNYVLTRLSYENWIERYPDFDFYVREEFSRLLMSAFVMPVFSIVYGIVNVVNYSAHKIQRSRVNDLKKIHQTSWCKKYIDRFINRMKKEGKVFDEKFDPSPCPPSLLPEKYIDWYIVTDGFRSNGISGLLSLWGNRVERIQVANFLDQELVRCQKAGSIIMTENELYASQLEIEKSIILENNDIERMSMVGEPFASLAEWELKYNQLEKRYNELEMEKTRLDEELKKAAYETKEKLRVFTLDEIVSYAERYLDLQMSMPILGLLHNLLSKDGTAYEREKVNGILTNINKRQALDLRGSNISMTNPLFHGSLYEIKDNDSVTFGLKEDGKEE